MREPQHAATVVAAMAKAVRIPVTVKMRAGWNEHQINAPVLARMVEGAGAAAVAVHGRTAAQAYSGESDWQLIASVASGLQIPVMGSGDCIDATQVSDRLQRAGVSGVLIGRGALRNPWIFAEAAEVGRPGQEACPERSRGASFEDRGRFLLDYIDLLLSERVNERAGFRHLAPGQPAAPTAPARGRERWVVNKLRALGSWYTKGLANGAHLRIAINSADSTGQLRHIIEDFFGVGTPVVGR
jgi:tRNA-dihydrouridine synthase B